MSYINLFCILAEKVYLEAMAFEDALEEGGLIDRLEGSIRLYDLHDGQRLDLSALSDEDCLSLFRFTLSEIQRIVDAMDLPESLPFRVNTPQQFHWNSVEALAMMLRRLVYPAKLIDLQSLFGVNLHTICCIFNEMIVMLFDKYHEGIRYNRYHMHPHNLRRFSTAISERGSCYEDVVGFIDSTINTTARPIEVQPAHNGHVNRQHGLKYQSIVTPDGITVSLCGPFIDSAHDQNMLKSSNILEDMVQQLNCRGIDGRHYAIYGDPAYYRETELLIPPLRNAEPSSAEAALNYYMSQVRRCVEWEFNNVTTLFAFLRFKPGQKLHLSRVGQFYLVATLLKNIHACLRRGNKTSSYFSVLPPTLEQYIREITPEKE